MRIHGYSMSRLFAECVVFGIMLLYFSSLFLMVLKMSCPFPEWSFSGIISWLWKGLVWPIRHEVELVGSSDANPRAHLTDGAIVAVITAWIYVAIDHVLAACKGTFSINIRPLRWALHIPFLNFLLRIFGKGIEWLVNKLSVRHNLRVLQERDKYASGLEHFFALSMNTLTPLQITLKNRKVYIGLIKNLPPLSPLNNQQKFVNIFPLMSGYRDGETLELDKGLTDYKVILDLLVMTSGGPKPQDAAYAKKLGKIAAAMNKTVTDHLDMGIAVDIEEILSASLWDGAVSQHFLSTKP